MLRPFALTTLLALSTVTFGCNAIAETPVAATAPTTFVPPTSLAPLVDAVEPAVVNVYVTQTQHANVSPQVQLQMQFFGMPTSRTVQGQGSGFVISPDGYLLTNNHVAADATDIRVKFQNGEEYPAKVVGTDEGSDIALLKIEAKKTLPWLKLGDSQGLRVGDWVVAIGNPLGLGHTVTAGIVSGKGRILPEEPLNEFIQTDASINPGNSGGPLLGVNGDVVGMNTAIIQGANTVGFAIPSAQLQTIVQQLRDDGKVEHGFLGVQMASLNDTGKKQLGVPGGVLVTEVEAESPAEAAGLKPGDVILKVDDTDISDSQALLRSVAGSPPGQKVKISVQRDGKARDLEVKLGKRPTAAVN